MAALLLATLVAPAWGAGPEAQAQEQDLRLQDGDSTVVGALALSPSSLEFPDTDVGDTATAQVQARNVGQAWLVIASATVQVDNGEAFAVTDDSCSGRKLGPGQACALTVVFRPVEPDEQAGALVVASGDQSGPHEVALRGTGVAGDGTKGFLQPERRELVAVDDHAQTVEGEAVQIAFGDNDIHPDGQDLRAFTTVTRQPAPAPDAPPEGSAELDELDLLIIYSPAPGFTGTVDFEYTTCDGEAKTVCGSATVTVDVLPGESVPEPVIDEGSFSGRSGPTLSGPCGDLIAWGGYENGRIPADRLTSIGDGHRLEATAAAAFVEMRQAARADGVRIAITDSYRSYEGQVEVRRRKGHLVATATPGTSTHGWGLAFDGAVPDDVRRWLEQRAADYGWINPEWAQRPGKSFEPWHYEYIGRHDDCNADQATTMLPDLGRGRWPHLGAVAAGVLALQLAAAGAVYGLWRRRQRRVGDWGDGAGKGEVP